MIGKPPAALECPVCHTPLSRSQVIEGLCPSCLLALALESPTLLAELEEVKAALGEAHVELRVWKRSADLLPPSRTSK